MKMPEKHDPLAAILAAKEQGIGAILVFAMAYLRGRYNGGAFTKTVIDATMCAIIAQFIRDLLDFAGLSSNLAYITSVLLSATSVLTRLVRLSNASLLKKAGVEDGRTPIINVRRSICWRGRRGTDNGRQKTRNHGYNVIVGGELFTDYSDHLANLSR